MEMRVGSMRGGHEYLAFGHGPPLVVFPGLSGENANPTGLERRMLVRPLHPLGAHFTVYLLNRRRGLAEGSTIGDLADQYAEALRGELTVPVRVMGVSTGGSVALQFAIDHPDLVSRLVVFASAFRLSPQGRTAQRELARLTLDQRPRQAWAAIGPCLTGSLLTGRLMAATMWLLGPTMSRRDLHDMLVTIAAEDVFDAEPNLSRITAPTLVVGGTRDRFYSVELFRRTSAGIPGGQLRLYPRKGHAAMMGHKPAIEDVRRFVTE